MVVFVTGGAAGIGKSVVEEFLNQGHQVGFLDIDKEAAGHLVERHTSGSLWFYHGDVRNQEDLKNAIEETIQSFGPIGALIVNAGTFRPNTILDLTDDDLDLIIDVNLKGAVFTLREGVKQMLEAGGGSVVIVASDQALIGKKNSFAYGMTKGALGQITKSMALDLSRHNIRVNAVCPGTIDTPLAQRVFQEFADRYYSGNITQVLKADAATHPMGRWGKPEEVAQLVYFLSTEKASFITGGLYTVDGGLTAG